MESDMDRWIQDRDRLSKQLEKCQMKYDNAIVLQKVRIVWASQIHLGNSPSSILYWEDFKKMIKFVAENGTIFSAINNAFPTKQNKRIELEVWNWQKCGLSQLFEFT